MAERTVLAGRYRIANEASLRSRMENLHGDPRRQFYQAMLATDRYEAYLDAIGQTKVSVPSFHQGPISGRMEMLYARRSGCEGQAGDMEFVRGNKAIRDHATSGKDLLLFETLKVKGKCRYLGSFVCGDWSYRDSTDKTGKNRKVIIFDLIPVENLDAPQPGLNDMPDKNISLEELRQRAYAAAASPPGGQGQSTRNVYVRSRDVRNWVLARAKGTCEACNMPAPFKRADGSPYLEPHHTRRLSDGGPDHPRWVGAICPTCHRRIHHGIDGAKLNEALQMYLGQIDIGGGDPGK